MTIRTWLAALLLIAPSAMATEADGTDVDASGTTADDALDAAEDDAIDAVFDAAGEVTDALPGDVRPCEIYWGLLMGEYARGRFNGRFTDLEGNQLARTRGRYDANQDFHGRIRSELGVRGEIFGQAGGHTYLGQMDVLGVTSAVTSGAWTGHHFIGTWTACIPTPMVGEPRPPLLPPHVEPRPVDADPNDPNDPMVDGTL